MPAVDVGVAIRREEQHRSRTVGLQEPPKQPEGRAIGPMHVVEHEQHWLLRADALHQHVDGVEDASALGLRVDDGHRHRVLQPCRELRHQSAPGRR